MEKWFLVLALMVVFTINSAMVALPTNGNDTNSCVPCQHMEAVSQCDIIGMAGTVLEYNGDVGVCLVRTPDGNIWECWQCEPMEEGANVTIFFQIPDSGNVSDWVVLDVV